MKVKQLLVIEAEQQWLVATTTATQVQLKHRVRILHSASRSFGELQVEIPFDRIELFEQKKDEVVTHMTARS